MVFVLPKVMVFYSATEHCLLLGLVSVRADLNYQQGLEENVESSDSFRLLLASSFSYW